MGCKLTNLGRNGVGKQSQGQTWRKLAHTQDYHSQILLEDFEWKTYVRLFAYFHIEKNIFRIICSDPAQQMQPFCMKQAEVDQIL